MVAKAGSSQCETDTCDPGSTAKSHKHRHRRFKRLRKLRAKHRRKKNMKKGQTQQSAAAGDKLVGTMWSQSTTLGLSASDSQYSKPTLVNCEEVGTKTKENVHSLTDKYRPIEHDKQLWKCSSSDTCDENNHAQSYCQPTSEIQVREQRAPETRPLFNQPGRTSTATVTRDNVVDEIVQSCQSCSDSRLQGSKVPGPERYLALDCEFVGVGPGKISALGRCSLVDYDGHVVLDLYVMPEEPITDYRTPWSGIRHRDMRRAVPLQSALRTIKKVIRGKIIVGHALFNDFRVLNYRHPADLVRDTHSYRPLRQRAGFDVKVGVSLKRLARSLLNLQIQGPHGHCSVEDARTTMSLFRLVRLEWEKSLATRQSKQSSEWSAQANTSAKLAGCRENLEGKYAPSSWSCAEAGIAKEHQTMANKEPVTTERLRTNSTSSIRSSFSESEEYLQDSFWPSDVEH